MDTELSIKNIVFNHSNAQFLNDPQHRLSSQIFLFTVVQNTLFTILKNLLKNMTYKHKENHRGNS